MFSKRYYEIITSFPNFNNYGFNIEDYNKKCNDGGRFADYAVLQNTDNMGILSFGVNAMNILCGKSIASILATSARN